jgi:NAD(P)-dependent dehydrogenase (short-subunit alcohol dehydrogenase family)
MMEFDLVGKTALVTGAGRGIGAAIARSLALAGANVVVNDIDGLAAERVAEEIRSRAGEALAWKGDASQPAKIKSLFGALLKWRPRLDILACNAGITNSKDIFTVTPKEWDHVIRTNVTGPFLCARYGMKIMRRQMTGGRIIFVGSGVVHQGALMGHVAYAASKGAIHSMARTLARTAAPFQITVNVIAPGSTNTELLHATHSESEITAIASAIPLGIGLPEDVGAAAVYLASDAARHVTGITLDVNGGQIIRP